MEERSIAPASVCYADGCLYLPRRKWGLALVEATPEAYREKGHFTPGDQPNRGQSKAWAYPAMPTGGFIFGTRMFLVL